MDSSIKKKISNIIWLYLFLSPVFDVITSFSIHFFSHSMPLILGIKILFLLFLLLINIKLKEKKSIFYSVFLCFYFFFFFILLLNFKGTSSLFLEAQNLFRTYYFPLVMLFLFFLQKNDIFQVKEKNLCYILFFYLIFLIIPELFHIGFSSYTQGKVGGLGWYYSTNEISGILAILGPFLLTYLKKKNWYFRIFAFLFYFFGILVIGTKVPVFAFIITITSFFLSFLLNLWKQKKWKTLFFSVGCSILIFCSFLFILFSTSFYKNIKTHLDFLEIKQVDDLFTFHNLDHFIFSQRLSFLQNTSNIYNQSNIMEKIFGMGHVVKIDNQSVSRKMIEIDYFDLFFSYGIVGSILFFLPLFLISLKRKYLLEEKISLLLVILLAFFSGHILIAPSVSILVVLIMMPKKEMD